MSKSETIKAKEKTEGNSSIIHFFKKLLSAYQTELSNFDYDYKKLFEEQIRKEIKKLHNNSNVNYCAFCKHLERSYCHNYCYKCSKNYFQECGLLIPGTFHFMSNYPDSEGRDTIPWALIQGCKSYEAPENYFKNFLYYESSIKVAMYEALEGIYLGITRGKRPCHICASVDINIYSSCMKRSDYDANTPCSEILKKITHSY